MFEASEECLCVCTFGQDLGDLGVAGAEGAVDLEAVGVIQKGAAQGEQHFLWKQVEKYCIYLLFICLSGPGLHKELYSTSLIHLVTHFTVTHHS